jgi:hypothetical protein
MTINTILKGLTSRFTPIAGVMLAIALILPGAVQAQQLAHVDLGTAGNYAVLAKTAVSTVPESEITGHVGISPAATTYITGFNLTLNTGYATSTQITGRAYAADMTNPTPSNLTTAVSNMEAAYSDAAGRADPDFSELHVGDLSGKTLVPGLYKWGTGVSAATDFALAGGPTDVWIFQIAQDLILSSDVKVTLQGGALAQNIFWQVAGEVTLGTNSHFEGVILSMTAIHLLSGVSINGRLLAQTAVTLDQVTITEPPASGQNTSIDGTGILLPGEVRLAGNYPNPFNPTTTIAFELQAQSDVHLTVYDVLGREVAVLAAGSRSAGRHSVSWDAGSAAGGLYLYRLSANGQVLVGTMTLLK